MTLGDVLMVEDGNLYTTALRVPGGWIYRSYDKSVYILSAVFVPYNNEFQGSEDETK